MMKLLSVLLLSLLFANMSYGFSVTTTYCTSSTDCSGDDCSITTAEFNFGCIEVEATGGSAEYSCENGLYNTTVYTSADCSGNGITTSVTSGECVESIIGGSTKIVCSDDSSSITKNVLFAVIIAFVASLFQ